MTIFIFSQCGIIYLIIMIESKRFQSLLFFAGEKIYTNIHENSNMSYIRVCNESAIKLLKSTLTTLFMLIASNVIYLGFPSYATMIHHEIQLTIPVLLPFTDLETSHGIVINILNQMFISTIGVVGNFGIEVATCMLKNTVWGVMVVICHSIDEISKLLQNSDDDSTESNSKGNIDIYFRNMLIQIQDFDR